MLYLKSRLFYLFLIISLFILTACGGKPELAPDFVRVASYLISCPSNGQLTVIYSLNFEGGYDRDKMTYAFKVQGEGGIGERYEYYQSGEGLDNKMNFVIPSSSIPIRVLMEITFNSPSRSLDINLRPITHSLTAVIPPSGCEQESSSNGEAESYEPAYVPPVVEPPVDEPPPPVELLAPDRVPEIINSTCVGSGEFKQLMVVFEFEQDVTGEYVALVADILYQLTPVSDYPNRLYYFGTPPPQGPITIRLVSTTDLSIAFEETYTPVVCGPQEKPEEEDGYHPPS